MHVYHIIGHLLGHMMGVLRPLTNNVGQRGMLAITDGRIRENEDCVPFAIA